MEISKETDTKTRYDGQSARENFTRIKWVTIVSGDEGAKKGTQLSLIEESYINKESEKQLRLWYDQFISSKYVTVRRLKECKIYRWG